MTHFTFATILIVDNFPGWQPRVPEILVADPECKIISEVSDGREAVQEATELEPYLVGLALPLLNGIEAARMIRQQSPFVVRQRGPLRIQSRPGGGHA